MKKILLVIVVLLCFSFKNYNIQNANELDKDFIYFEIEDYSNFTEGIVTRIDFSFMGLFLSHIDVHKSKTMRYKFIYHFDLIFNSKISILRDYIIKNDLLKYQPLSDSELYDGGPINFIIKYRGICNAISYKGNKYDDKLENFIKIINTLIPEKYFKYFKICEIPLPADKHKKTDKIQ